MNLKKSLFAALVVAAALATAVPASSQTDPWKDVLNPKDLSRLQAMHDLQLKDLALLEQRVRALTDEIAKNVPRDLARDLARLHELPQVRELARLGHEFDHADVARIVEEVQRAVRGLDHADVGRIVEQAERAARSVDRAEIARMAQEARRAARESLRSFEQSRPPRPPRAARSRGPEQTESVDKTFRVGANGALDLHNVAGDVVVKAGAGQDIVIRATKRAPQGSDAQRQLQAVTIDAVERGGRVEVRTRYPENQRNIRTSVDYMVTVPAGAAITVHTTAGDVTVTGVKGALRADTVSGNVVVEGAEQIELVKAVSGDVRVTGGAGADVRATTYNGTLTLLGVKAKSLDANAISGDITLTDVAAERATVNTMSGDVEYSGAFSRSGRYDLSSHSGDLRITAVGGIGFEVDAETFSGEIHSDLGQVAKASAGRRQFGKQVRGTIGDGGARLHAKTFSGDITIAKK